MKTDSKTSYIVADEIVFMEVVSKKKEHLDHLFHVTKQLRINQLSKVSQLVQLTKKIIRNTLKQIELDYTN